MTHFGIPIESYFPWYTYTKDESMPIINDELRNKFTMALSSEYSPLMYVWIAERGYNNEEFIRNRALIEEEKIKYFMTPLGFMDSRTISVDFNKKIGYLSLKEDTIKFSVDNWIEVEQKRLFYLLGVKEKALEYISTINNILELDDIVDYHRTIMEEDGCSFDMEIDNFENLLNRDIYISDPSDAEIIDIIQSYNDNNIFCISLKSYLANRGHLTYKQLRAASKILKREIMLKRSKNICLHIKYNDYKSEKEVNSLIHRLESIGYIGYNYNNGLIIYKNG